MNKMRSCLIYLLVGLASASAFAERKTTRLELIPPSPVTDKVILDIRGAVENDSSAARQYSISLYLDRESPSALLHTCLLYTSRCV